MRILFVADARSPIARAWISNFVQRDYDVHVISSYACAPSALPAEVHTIPVAFSGLARVQHNGTVDGNLPRSPLTRALARLRTGDLSGLATAARFWLGPFDLKRHVRATRELLKRISPDIVHAMRIPFEGMLATLASPPELPVLVSIWGNDFTLFADSNAMIGRHTRLTMKRADAIHSDCDRDLRLATQKWGFGSDKPSTVLPSSGGIHSSVFRPGDANTSLLSELGLHSDAPVVINPRGFRSYVRNDVFFQALPKVISVFPDAVFVCTGMAGSPVAEKWVRRHSIQDSVRLLPSVSRERMAELFRLAQLSVSPSLHDGTPNTLLEAMACGSFPVAGDIESIREWITDGVNGLLCDATSADALASAMIRALRDSELRRQARQENLDLIAERADYDKVMPKAESFYAEILARKERCARV